MIPFVDTHHHLWNLDLLPYAWLEDEDPDEAALLGDYAAIRHNYLLDDFLADIAESGVSASVHVQAEYSGPDPVEETAWLQELSDRSGFPHALVVACDLRAGDAGEQLDRHLEHPAVRGVRTFVDGDDLLDARFRSGIDSLGSRGLLYEMQIDHRSTGQARRLAAAHPDVRFVLEHTGMPEQRDDPGFDRWRSGLRELATAENVAVKISGLGMLDHVWTVDTIRARVLTAIETFGVERTVFGSNWPVDGLYGDYGELVEAYRTLAGAFSRHEQELLLHGNAERIYRIPEGHRPC